MQLIMKCLQFKIDLFLYFHYWHYFFNAHALVYCKTKDFKLLFQNCWFLVVQNSEVHNDSYGKGALFICVGEWIGSAISEFLLQLA